MRVLLASVAVAAVVAGATTAGAAAKPQIVDAKGDTPVAVADIVKGSLTLVKPRKKSMTIALELAAPPTTTNPHSYSVTFTVADCLFRAAYYGHPFEGVFTTSGVGCTVEGETSLPEGAVEVKGSTITWTVPLFAPVKPGAKLTALEAATEFSGVMSGGPAQAVGDTATGPDWVIR